MASNLIAALAHEYQPGEGEEDAEHRELPLEDATAKGGYLARLLDEREQAVVVRHYLSEAPGNRSLFAIDALTRYFRDKPGFVEMPKARLAHVAQTSILASHRQGALLGKPPPKHVVHVVQGAIGRFTLERAVLDFVKQEGVALTKLADWISACQLGLQAPQLKFRTGEHIPVSLLRTRLARGEACPPHLAAQEARGRYFDAQSGNWHCFMALADSYTMTYEGAVEEALEDSNVMQEILSQRRRKEHRLNRANEVGPLALRGEARLEIAELPTRVWQRGTMLLRSGEHPETVLRVLAGQVRVLAQGPPGTFGTQPRLVEVDRLGRGAWIGALACVEGRPAQCSFAVHLKCSALVQEVSAKVFRKKLAPMFDEALWSALRAQEALWDRAASRMAEAVEGVAEAERAARPQYNVTVPRECLVQCCPNLGLLQQPRPPPQPPPRPPFVVEKAKTPRPESAPARSRRLQRSASRRSSASAKSGKGHGTSRGVGGEDIDGQTLTQWLQGDKEYGRKKWNPTVFLPVSSRLPFVDIRPTVAEWLAADMMAEEDADEEKEGSGGAAATGGHGEGAGPVAPAAPAPGTVDAQVLSETLVEAFKDVWVEPEESRVAAEAQAQSHEHDAPRPCDPAPTQAPEPASAPPASPPPAEQPPPSDTPPSTALSEPPHDTLVSAAPSEPPEPVSPAPSEGAETGTGEALSLEPSSARSQLMLAAAREADPARAKSSGARSALRAKGHFARNTTPEALAWWLVQGLPEPSSPGSLGSSTNGTSSASSLAPRGAAAPGVRGGGSGAGHGLEPNVEASSSSSSCTAVQASAGQVVALVAQAAQPAPPPPPPPADPGPVATTGFWHRPAFTASPALRRRPASARSAAGATDHGQPRDSMTSASDSGPGVNPLAVTALVSALLPAPMRMPECRARPASAAAGARRVRPSAAGARRQAAAPVQRGAPGSASMRAWQGHLQRTALTSQLGPQSTSWKLDSPRPVDAFLRP